MQRQQQQPHQQQLEGNLRQSEGISPIVLKETKVHCPVEGCGRLLGSDFSQASFAFALDENVDLVLSSGRAERRRLLSKFLKMVNVLLNQGGGLVFIHTNRHFLGFWDEQVDDHLMELLSDDTLFDENFERYLVEEHVIFRVKPVAGRPLSTLDFQSKVSLNKGLADPTHGQMRRLLSRKDPEKSVGRDHDQQGSLLDTNQLQQGQQIPFHENFNVQAKVVLSKDVNKKTPESLTDAGSKLVHYWWNSLKLPHYISAFAKQQRGGSFFLGLREEKKVSELRWKPLPNTDGLMAVLQSDMRFWADDKNTEEKLIFHVAKEEDVPKVEHKTGFFICEGIQLSEQDKEVVETQLKKKMEEELYLHSCKNQEQNLELVHLYFHPVKDTSDTTTTYQDRKEPKKEEAAAFGFGSSSFGPSASAAARDGAAGSATAIGAAAGGAAHLFVIEARVNYYHGVCFLNKEGPDAYMFDHNQRPTLAERVPVQKWVQALNQA